MLNRILSASFSLNYERMFVKLEPSIESKRTLVDIFTQPEMIKSLVEIYDLKETDPISKYREIMVALINRMHLTLLHGYPILNDKVDDFASLTKSIFDTIDLNLEGKIDRFFLDIDRKKDLIMFINADESIGKIQKKLIDEYQKVMNIKNLPTRMVPHITIMRLNDEKRDILSRNIPNFLKFGNNLRGEKLSFDNLMIDTGHNKIELSV